MEDITATLVQVFYGILLFFCGIITVGIIAVLGMLIFSRQKFKKLVEQRLTQENEIVLLIKMPKSNDKKETAMESFLHALHRVLPNNAYLSLELASSSQFLRFYIVLPKPYRHLLESQLYAQYPEAEVEVVQDYLRDFDVNTAFLQLNFKKPSTYPLQHYQNIEGDMLRNLSALLSKTEQGEEVIIQLALKRVGSKFWERGWRALAFKLSGKKSIGDTQHPVQYKLEKDLYRGKIRLAYVARDKYTAHAKLETFVGIFKSMKGPYNELKKKKKNYSQDIKDAFKSRLFERGDLFTPAEIATLYHFPYSDSIISNVVDTSSKRAPAPDILPREGMVNPSEVSFIGETNYRNDGVRFGLKRPDRRRHLYIVGKTGSGKSRLLELLFLADIQNGDGCCLLDPHGDLADELLMYIPKERIKDVVYVNPADRDFPIGFNPLEPVEDYEIRQHLSRFFISIFKKMFAGNWNDRMEHLIRYITLALLETPDASVLGIPRMISDTAFRQRVIKQIQDPVVKSFWTNEFSSSNEQFLSGAAIPIMNKVGQFISNPIIRNMVGQQKNQLNFDQFMDTGKIVLVNLSKGKLGEENAALLGSMMITKIQQAALSRAKIPEEERRDFYFYVDEFQNFATDAFSSILSEARKYRLDLTVAHQYMAQLPADVKATAFGNVGTIITFAVGADDAAYLSKEFAPIFSADDMINLNTREMYIRMSVDGKLATPFSARTLNVPKPQFDYSVEILDHSRKTYGRNRVEVENEILQWTQTDSTFTSAPGAPESQLTDFPEPII